jgi:hypothetical protein
MSTRQINIDDFTEEELIDLNYRIVERLRMIDQMRNHTEMMEFSIGETVSFITSGGSEQVGILVKYNRRTVTVITNEGRRWNVSPQLLTKVQKQKYNTEKPKKIIEFKKRKDA